MKKVVKKSTKQTTKKVAKAKAITYMDVFNRVVDIMRFDMGYGPDYELAENGEAKKVDICLDDDGWEHRIWENARTFLVGATEGDSKNYEGQSIFDLMADLYKSRYELNEWDESFESSCRPLGKVKVRSRTPLGVMRALDKADL